MGSQSSDDLDTLPEVKQGKPTTLSEKGGESPEATGVGSFREAAGSQSSDDLDALPEVPCAYETPSAERPAVDKISAMSIRSPIVAALPAGMELRETCGGSSLPSECNSLPTGDELRALVLGTHTIDPLLSGRSMLPVRPLSCQASSTRASNLYGTCNGLLLPATSGALPTAHELYKALHSPRSQSGSMRV